MHEKGGDCAYDGAANSQCARNDRYHVNPFFPVGPQISMPSKPAMRWLVHWASPEEPM